MNSNFCVKSLKIYTNISDSGLLIRGSTKEFYQLINFVSSEAIFFLISYSL